MSDTAVSPACLFLGVGIGYRSDETNETNWSSLSPFAPHSFSRDRFGRLVQR